MSKRIREPFGKAGLIVAVIALVAALVGGAYAANRPSDDGASAAKRKGKAKKKPKGVTVQQVRRIARQEARKFASAGPMGPQGVPGLPGPKGSDGDDGDDGSNGKEGKEGKQGPQGSPGDDGTFSTEPLPSEETLTGVWTASGGEGDVSWAPISFPIQVSPAPDLVWIQPQFGGVAFFIAAEEGKGNVEPIEDPEAVEALCPGSAAEPQAEPGNLCVYPEVQSEVGANFAGILSVEMTGPSPFGSAILYEILADEGYARGTWAVTAL